MIHGGPPESLAPVHGLEITDLLDRCIYVVSFRKRSKEDDWYHDALGGHRHPDADIIRVEFNTEIEVFHKGSRIHHLPNGLNTAWGPTPMRAAKRALEMLDHKNIYTQCPCCKYTQWDKDFEPVPGTIKQRCRLCGNERDLQ